MSVDARLNVNVALKRPAYQSGMYEDGIGTYIADNANDGGHGTELLDGSCAHTAFTTNPWWAVDLGVALHVYGVKFTNRNNSRTYISHSQIHTSILPPLKLRAAPRLSIATQSVSQKGTPALSIITLTRKPCYRKDDRAMHPIAYMGALKIFGIPCMATPTANFPDIFNGLLFRSIP